MRLDDGWNQIQFNLSGNQNPPFLTSEGSLGRFTGNREVRISHATRNSCKAVNLKKRPRAMKLSERTYSLSVLQNIIDYN